MPASYVSRFARLQDTLGDKLLPQLLRALGEKTASTLDNLNVAERLGYKLSAYYTHISNYVK